MRSWVSWLWRCCLQFVLVTACDAIGKFLLMFVTRLKKCVSSNELKKCDYFFYGKIALTWRWFNVLLKNCAFNEFFLLSFTNTVVELTYKSWKFIHYTCQTVWGAEYSRDKTLMKMNESHILLCGIPFLSLSLFRVTRQTVKLSLHENWKGNLFYLISMLIAPFGFIQRSLNSDFVYYYCVVGS